MCAAMRAEPHGLGGWEITGPNSCAARLYACRNARRAAWDLHRMCCIGLTHATRDVAWATLRGIGCMQSAGSSSTRAALSPLVRLETDAVGVLYDAHHQHLRHPNCVPRAPCGPHYALCRQHVMPVFSQGRWSLGGFVLTSLGSQCLPIGTA